MTPFLMSLLFALPALSQQPSKPPASDVVYVRKTLESIDTRVVEGKATLNDKEVEVLLPNGETTRVPREKVLRIEYAPTPINFPELAEVDPALLEERVAYDHFSLGKVLVYVPKQNGKIVGIDITTGKPAWPAIEFPPKEERPGIPDGNRLGDPKQFGSVLYLMAKKKYSHATKTITIQGRTIPKEIQELTLMAIEISTGNVLWKNDVSNDNPSNTRSRNPNDNLYWKHPDKTPALFQMQDKILFIMEKTGHPITQEGKVDNRKPTQYWTFNLHGVDSGKIEKTSDTTEKMYNISNAMPHGDRELIFLRELGRQKFEFVSILASNGKTNWKSDPINAKHVATVKDDVYVSDGENLFVHSIKNRGKRKPRWNFYHKHGTIHEIDERFIYYYRTLMDPCGILLINPKDAKQTHLIDLPPGDKFTFWKVENNLLYYTDAKNVVHCFDTNEMKKMWEWESPDRGKITFFHLEGNILTVLKEKDLVMIDTTTGIKLWEARADFERADAAGNAGFLGILPRGKTILVRQRADLPKESLFLTDSGSALQNILREGVFSLPAFFEDRLYTFGQSGTAYVFDFKEKKQEPLQSQHMGQFLKGQPATPMILGGMVFYHTGNSIKVCDPADISKVLNSLDRTFLPSPNLPLTPYDDGILTLTHGALVHTRLEPWGENWKGPTGVISYTIDGDKAYLVTSAGLSVTDLTVGKAQKMMKIQGGTNRVVTDGKIFYTARGPYEVVESREREFLSLFVSTNQDRSVQRFKFAGSLALSESKILFSGSDGKVVCLSGKIGDPPAWSFAAPNYTSKLLAHEGCVWFAANGIGLFGLNVEDGNVVWKQELRDADLFIPFLHEGKPAFWSTAGWMVVPGRNDAGAESEKNEDEPKPEEKKDEAEKD